jgi:DNA-binding NarL/FixJ family response regulator
VALVSPAFVGTCTQTGELPGTRVLVLSASGEHADVLEAVKAGASGYLPKPSLIGRSGGCEAR